MRHIEFFGIPGSGKSTLVEPTIKYLEQDGKLAKSLKESFRYAIREEITTPIPKILLQHLPVSYISKHQVSIYYWKGCDSKDYQLFFTDHPELGSIIPEYIAKKADDVVDRRVYSNWFHKLITRYYASQRLNEHWVVIDEGFVNRTITLFCGHSPVKEHKADLERYISNIPKPDLVIVPQVPVEVAASRIRKGNRDFPYRVSETDHQEQLEYLRERKEHVDTVINILNDEGVNTVLVDNSGEKSETERDLRTNLEWTVLTDHA